jgi:hypothetical protein
MSYFQPFLAFIVLAFQAPLNAQTSLYIIGTQHQQNNYINPVILEDILEDIHPHVVLIELDSSFFTPQFTLDTLRFPDLLSTNENIACNRYKKRQPVQLRPYDIPGRNEFYMQNNYFQQEADMYNAIAASYEKGELSTTSMQAFDIILQTLSSTEQVNYRSLSELNSEPAIALTSLRQTILYDLTLSIVQTNPVLHPWVSFALLQKEYWISRNESMSNQILHYAQEFENQTIVVFTGSNHLYLLRDHITKNQSICNIKLNQYWGDQE